MTKHGNGQKNLHINPSIRNFALHCIPFLFELTILQDMVYGPLDSSQQVQTP